MSIQPKKKVIDEINDTIVELGGDKLAGWYWSCSGGNGYNVLDVTGGRRPREKQTELF